MASLGSVVSAGGKFFLHQGPPSPDIHKGYKSIFTLPPVLFYIYFLHSRRIVYFFNLRVFN